MHSVSVHLLSGAFTLGLTGLCFPAVHCQMEFKSCFIKALSGLGHAWLSCLVVLSRILQRPVRHQCRALEVSETFAVMLPQGIIDSLPVSNQNLEVLILLAQEKTLPFLHMSKEGTGWCKSSRLHGGESYLRGTADQSWWETHLGKSCEVGRENLECFACGISEAEENVKENEKLRSQER